MEIYMLPHLPEVRATSNTVRSVVIFLKYIQAYKKFRMSLPFEKNPYTGQGNREIQGK